MHVRTGGVSQNLSVHNKLNIESKTVIHHVHRAFSKADQSAIVLLGGGQFSFRDDDDDDNDEVR